MKSNTIVIFTGGEAPVRKTVECIAENAFTDSVFIAADSGAAAAEQYDIIPDILIGDMDSIGSEKAYISKAAEVKKFPQDKDYTDTELALLEADKYEYEKIILIGGNGGRLDHLLALRSLYERNKSGIPYPDIWFCGNNAVFCLDKDRKYSLCIRNLHGKGCISFFPLFGEQGEPIIHSKGLMWDISSLNWRQCGGSVSNRAGKTENGVQDVELSVLSGRFLVIIPLSDESVFKVL